MTSTADVRPLGDIKRIDPRYLIAFLITLVLVAAQFRFHMVGGYERLALALGTCVAVEAVLSWYVRGKVASPLSAYISGISLTLLIKPQGARALAVCRRRVSRDLVQVRAPVSRRASLEPDQLRDLHAAARRAESHRGAQPPVGQRRAHDWW